MRKIVIICLLVVGFSGFGIDRGLIAGFELGYNFYDSISISTITGRGSYVSYDESLYIQLTTGYRLGNFRMIGTYKNTLHPLKMDRFSPVQDRYSVEVNYTFDNFKIGFKHYCDHPVIANSDTRYYYKNESVRSLYISYYREF